MNKVVLIGRVGKDAETIVFDSGKCLTSFSLATTTTFSKDNQRTDWHNIKAWGDRFKNLSKYITKGRELCVEGRIENGSYEKDGVKIYVTDVIVEDIELIGGNINTNNDNTATGKSNTPTSTSRTQREIESTPNAEPNPDDEGLPF